MCTPDLRGTQGTFSKFSESGGLLEGPEGESVECRVTDGWLEIQGQRVTLRPGQYTGWVRLNFSAGRGIARFLRTSNGIYVTPVQIDPERPALPISYPPYYAAWLSKALGTFSTLGMAEDTTALNEGAIDRNEFLEQARLIQEEREAMFFSTLDRAQNGTVACVFDTTDRVQHMCFEDQEVVERLYRDMDRILGKTLEYVKEKTAIFVLSDHGFQSFRRGVNPNAWLMHEGYLALTGEPGKHLAGIDWSRTRAYSFGLGGVYLNLRGREAQGIVEPEEGAALRREIADKLTGLRDGGSVAIERAWSAEELYRGPYFDAAPDLIIGYADGYRASWDAANGIVSDAIFEDNTKAWCADHCVDPRLVPGVLFSNLPLNAEDPGIEDMAPTALRLFGIEPPEWMEGSSVCA